MPPALKAGWRLSTYRRCSNREPENRRTRESEELVLRFSGSLVLRTDPERFFALAVALWRRRRRWLGRRAKRAGDHIVHVIHIHKHQLALDMARNLGDVALVVARQDHRANAGAMRAKNLLFDA